MQIEIEFLVSKNLYLIFLTDFLSENLSRTQVQKSNSPTLVGRREYFISEHKIISLNLLHLLIIRKSIFLFPFWLIITFLLNVKYILSVKKYTSRE